VCDCVWRRGVGERERAVLDLEVGDNGESCRSDFIKMTVDLLTLCFFFGLTFCLSDVGGGGGGGGSGGGVGGGEKHKG
jgi:hypothetical protein